MTLKKQMRERMIWDLEKNDIRGINLDRITVRQKNALINWAYYITKEGK